MSRDRSSSATHDKLDEPKKRNIEWKQEATEYHTHYTLFIKLIDNTKDPWKQPKAWILEPNCLDSNSSFVTHWHVILGKTLNLCVCFLICEMEMTKTCKVLATVDMLKGRNTGRRGRVSSLLSLRWTVGACVLKLYVHMYVSTYQYFFKHKGMGSIHGLGISPGAGMATHSDILDWKFHGQRSLVGYSPCGRRESDTTEHKFCWKPLDHIWLQQLRTPWCLLHFSQVADNWFILCAGCGSGTAGSVHQAVWRKTGLQRAPKLGGIREWQAENQVCDHSGCYRPWPGVLFLSLSIQSLVQFTLV